ncbi:MAG: HAD family hydrolase [bacterium]
MREKIIVLDLDDTLYEEMSFVKGGFLAVASYLQNSYKVPRKKSFDFMLNELNKGRGKIFDDLLKHFGLFSKNKVIKLISVYRSHRPKIDLYPDAKRFLKRFTASSKYIVTDGNKQVQLNKVKALKVEDSVKKVFITHRFGRKNAKPSLYCFLKIAKMEKVSPPEIVYIADDPQKDFIGIKKLGFNSIRVLRGNHKLLKLAKKFEADLEVKNLDEIDKKMLKDI